MTKPPFVRKSLRFLNGEPKGKNPLGGPPVEFDVGNSLVKGEAVGGSLSRKVKCSPFS